MQEMQKTLQKTPGFDPWVGEVPWRRTWQPTLVFLPGKSHGQRRQVGYSPWGLRELAMTEAIEHKPSLLERGWVLLQDGSLKEAALEFPFPFRMPGHHSIHRAFEFLLLS